MVQVTRCRLFFSVNSLQLSADSFSFSFLFLLLTPVFCFHAKYLQGSQQPYLP
jgi:hypothetical protein